MTVAVASCHMLHHHQISTSPTRVVHLICVTSVSTICAAGSPILHLEWRTFSLPLQMLHLVAKIPLGSSLQLDLPLRPQHHNHSCIQSRLNSLSRIRHNSIHLLKSKKSTPTLLRIGGSHHQLLLQLRLSMLRPSALQIRHLQQLVIKLPQYHKSPIHIAMLRHVLPACCKTAVLQYLHRLVDQHHL